MMSSCNIQDRPINSFVYTLYMQYMPLYEAGAMVLYAFMASHVRSSSTYHQPNAHKDCGT